MAKIDTYRVFYAETVSQGRVEVPGGAEIDAAGVVFESADANGEVQFIPWGQIIRLYQPARGAKPARSRAKGRSGG